MTQLRATGIFLGRERPPPLRERRGRDPDCVSPRLLIEGGLGNRWAFCGKLNERIEPLTFTFHHCYRRQLLGYDDHLGPRQKSS